MRLSCFTGKALGLLGGDSVVAFIAGDRGSDAADDQIGTPGFSLKVKITPIATTVAKIEAVSSK